MTLSIRVGGWSELGEAALLIRERVFVVEQGVPLELEHDSEDFECIHAVAFFAAEVVGTGRLTPSGHIGRMAVLSSHRGRGVGSRLLAALAAQARMSNVPDLYLNAQIHAIPFYERLGFVASGPVFDDAGIPHRRMHVTLAGLKV